MNRKRKLIEAIIARTVRVGDRFPDTNWVGVEHRFFPDQRHGIRVTWEEGDSPTDEEIKRIAAEQIATGILIWEEIGKEITEYGLEEVVMNRVRGAGELLRALESADAD